MLDLEEIREKVVLVLVPYGATRIAVFGSVARGEERPDSDVDLLVTFRPRNERPHPAPASFDIEEELGRILGRDVDVVSEDSMSPYMHPYIQDDLVVLYDASAEEPNVPIRRPPRVRESGPRKHQSLYLLHILDEIARIERFVGSSSYEHFERDELVQAAVIRCIEIIGEASSKLSADFRQRHPEVPRGQIVGMRNRVIHEYFTVKLEEVWKVIRSELPLLKEQIQRILAGENPDA